ncbi:ATP-binding protein [Pseudomonas syringae group genomosp. 3]|uniref:histidine kinase n=1 Tax=Pseudomonas syringae pv. persicae TaxID=237306 RepID=A0AB38EER7_9PSED|nr:ATP-binding protein [Pseudomonas syringae group genomosp. 3]SOQ10502.1 bacteriophytochrome [Pseudomonas syringae pv. persicae]SOQ10616.1 bacteriophytochrome [Pseudomonas syringae pv. persicae]
MIEHTLDANPDAALEAALAECAREPIRIPCAIQPHGVLLSVAGDPLCIEQVSANCAKSLGLESAELLGQPLSILLSAAHSMLINQAYSQPAMPNSDPIRLTVRAVDYNASLSRAGDVLIIELEPFVEAAQDQSRIITRVLRNLQAATSLETLFDIGVHEIQALTGYDRVMIYRFEPEGHGKVVAQALTGPLPSYSGLNFPGSDIPAQARELYRLNWIRLIPDATYVPVALIPTLRPATGQPLDLSFSTLRSVSPVHCEYLKNMGVRSSMSISLLDGGELWGLITCSHPEPLLVSRELRDACAMIGQLLSVKISAIVATHIQREREEKVVLLGQLADAMNRADHEILHGLVSRPQLLQALTQADGAAVLIDDQVHLFGQCPTSEEVRALYQWIRDTGLTRQRSKERATGLQGLGVFHTDSMQRERPESAAYRETASGVIAFTLPKPVDNAVMWFRSQLASTMNWSGDPAHHVSTRAAGSASHRLRPRQSFDVWKQEVTGIARPWSRADLYGAEDIRRSALESDLERQVQREQEAVRLRDELVAVVSHDLRNPMSIIIMQCGMMQRWAVGDTNFENRNIRRALGTIEKATTRMNSLLEDLLDTAQIEAGRYQLSRLALSVTSLLEEACSLLVMLTTEKNIELNCTSAQGLVIDADPERIFQVLSNLVGNAIKFTPKGGRINIDAVADGDDVLFRVSDDGIGIPAQHLPYIFQRYWSVKEGNPRGNGLGLYICQGIITAHGGRLWADSSLDSGSVFSFTLPMHQGQDTIGESTFLKQSGTTHRLAQSISSKLERQQLEDRLTRAGLLNELNHRVKNTLATVQAIASLTVNSSTLLDSFRKSFDARLFALSQAHDALARAEWMSTELADLLEQLQGVNGGQHRIAFTGDPVRLEPRISLTLSMVLHELMANALQHGALSSPAGQVTVASTLNSHHNPPTLSIDWLETEGPPVVASTVKGFGLRLIRRSIERELKGKVDIKFASTGVSWSMLIPWPEKPESSL